MFKSDAISMRGMMSKKVLYGFFVLVLLLQVSSGEKIDAKNANSLRFLANTPQEDSDTVKFNHFLKFMSKYDRKYSSVAMLENRFNIFKQNLKDQNITLTNDTQPDSGEMFTTGIGPFIDLTPEEFAQQYLTYKGSQLDQADANNNNIFIIQDTSANNTNNSQITDSHGKKKTSGRNLQTTSIPSSFDWRNYGAVTSVKNQGTCGDCWAFAAAANIEGQYYLKYGQLYNFSEQQLLDCSTANYGCNGGTAPLAYQYIKSVGGLEAYNNYPYLGYQSTCQFQSSLVVAQVSAYAIISTNESYMQQALYQYGPLAVALNANYLQFYTSGILSVSNSLCTPTDLNHAVLLVGYGTSASGYNYWIVKNSWGSTWGENGYFRILRGYGTCGINLAVTTAILQ